MSWPRSTPAKRQVAYTEGDRLPNAVVADLVARAKQGDGEAFATLYDHFAAQVYGFLAARLSQREEVEDMTQAIFLRALHSLHSCRQDAAFAGWLFTIARNMVTDHYRAARFHPTTLEETFDMEDLTLTPEEATVQRDDVRVLQDARERCLSAAERELFDLLLTEMSDKQIAQTLGRGYGAIRTAHYRLMANLRDCLEGTPGFSGGHHAAP